MKKIIFCCITLVVSLFLFSCKSNDVVSTDDVLITSNNADGNAEELEGTEDSSGDEKTEKNNSNNDDIVDGNSNSIEKTVSGEKSSDAKDEAEDVKNNVSEQSKNMEPADNVKVSEKKTSDNRGLIGWIDMGVKNPFEKNGIVDIRTNSKLGTFCIYVSGRNGKSYPVFSTLNEFSSSGFYLKAGNKIYKLISDRKIKTYSENINNGIKIKYNIKDVANVTLDMNTISSVKDSVPDTVKFTITVRNAGKSSETFALKAILDTILGENGGVHFYTSDDSPVDKDFFSKYLEDEKWFLSRNDKASMQVILYGGDVTTPECVALANYATLEKAAWVPNIQGYGTFDTVLSYNDSAIGIYWPEVNLPEGEIYKTVFYISLAQNGNIPGGYNYVSNLGSVKKENKQESKKENNILSEVTVKEETANDNVVEDVLPEEKKHDDSDKVMEDKSNNAEKENAESENVLENDSEDGKILDIEFNVKDIAKEHLTQEYIQGLIERIAELEASGPSVNRGEILQLNAELDAILSIIR